MSNTQRPPLKPLIISAPFGNYIQPPDATATLGTFTLHRRPGRFRQVLLTVRYYPRLRAWVNRLGLRNPGVDWLVEHARSSRASVTDKIVSIHGLADDEWYALLDRIAAIKPAALELNMSCPNIGEVNWPADLFHRALATNIPVIAKLPPVNWRTMFDQSLAAGIRAYHCCNTLPVPAGGMSGKPLKPVALQCIRDLLAQVGPARSQLTLIGGGGISCPMDIDDYAAAGATHFAIATKLFNPIYLLSHAGLRPLIDRATAILPVHGQQG